MYPFYSIGHATRGIEEFISRLQGEGITVLADVRSVPRSLKNPQFNEAVLPQVLQENGIAYLRIPALGGFRAKSKTILPEVNAFWRHNSFHSYADYAMGEAFREGLNVLLKAGNSHRTAFMCAEMLWWRCHRRIIADYLLIEGQAVFHIVGKHAEQAQLTECARLTPGGAIVYPLEEYVCI